MEPAEGVQNYFNSARMRFLLTVFFSAMLMYIAFYILKGKSFIPYRVGELIQLGWIGVLFSCSIILFKYRFESKYLTFCFGLYMIWAIIVVYRGMESGLMGLIAEILRAEYGGIIYYVPLFILLPSEPWLYKRLFDFIFISGGVFFICAFLTRNDLLSRTFETQDSIETLARLIGIASGFILMTFKYHSTKRLLLAGLVMAVSILLSVYKARRGLTLTLGSVSLAALFLYLRYTRYKILSVYLLSLVLIAGALYATGIYNVGNNQLLNRMSDRGTEDTRLGVELYFYNDMRDIDWAIGRGMNGSYYCPGIDEGALTDNRKLIETGYLQIILKGGLVRLILFLLIMVPAVFLGLFHSGNLLSKAAAIWILIAVGSLYPATVEAFSLWYILVWLSAGICYSKRIRNMRDEELEFYFKKND